MATYTENYNLTMPEGNDYYNVEDFNENFETIDTLMAENEAVCTEINEKIGTPENDETVFSLLKSGGSVIKSIQHVTYSIAASTSTGNVTINEVDPTKCFVIFERLQNLYTSDTRLEYTLNATSLSIKHDNHSEPNLKSTLFGFWIIEFN